MLEDIKRRVREVEDFPKPGIGFKDITPVLQDPAGFGFIIDDLARWAEEKEAQLIVGIESRGFLFAAPVAYKLGLGLSLIRKKGKLPWECVCVQAPNEYAVEFFEMHRDGLEKGQKVIILDDLIATGSSSISAVELAKSLGGKVLGFGALVELSFLKGREAIRAAHPDIEIRTLIDFKE